MVGMKQKARVGTRRSRSRGPGQQPILTIRLNPKELSEEELEYLYYLQHRHEKRYPIAPGDARSGLCGGTLSSSNQPVNRSSTFLKSSASRLRRKSPYSKTG